MLNFTVPNAIHVTCHAHIAQLVGNCWPSAFPHVKQFLLDFRAIINHSGRRKNQLLTILKEENAPRQCLPPKSNSTRWNSWFLEITWHAQNIEYYERFVSEQMEENRDNSNAAAVHQFVACEELVQDLKFIAQDCKPIVEFLDQMQSNSVPASDVYNAADDLLTWLENRQQIEEIENRAHVFSMSAAKLRSYIVAGKQPALEFFKAVRIFDPRQIGLLATELYSYTAVFPKLLTCQDEWPIYIKLAKEHCLRDDFDLISFWASVSLRLPKLHQTATVALAIPNNSAEVERSFSRYHQICSDDRRNLKEQSKKTLCMAYYNHMEK